MISKICVAFLSEKYGQRAGFYFSAATVALGSLVFFFIDAHKKQVAKKRKLSLPPNPTPPNDSPLPVGPHTHRTLRGLHHSCVTTDEDDVTAGIVTRDQRSNYFFNNLTMPVRVMELVVEVEKEETEDRVEAVSSDMQHIDDEVFLEGQGWYLVDYRYQLQLF